MSDWTPVEQVAKDDNGNYMALVNGQWVPAIAGAKNDEGKYIAQFQPQSVPTQQVSSQPKEKSFTEQIFGEGPAKEMPISDRLERLGYAGLTGMGIGGGIGAGMGAMAGGVGAIPGAFGGAVAGGLGGLFGEAGEQLSSAFGGDRLNQLITGAGAGMLGEVPNVLGTAGRNALHALSYAMPGLPGAGARAALAATKEETLSPAVQEAVRAAQQRLRGETGVGVSTGEKATREFGGAVTEAVQREKQQFASAAEQAAKRAEEFVAKFNTAASQRERMYYDQAAQAQQNLAETLNAGIGKGPSDFDLGTQIRTKIRSINNPIAQQRSKEYQEAAGRAFESARASENAGEYWPQTEGAQAILAKWKDIASRSSSEVKNQINSVINDIWKKEPIKNEWGEVTGYTDKPLSAEGIDQIVRRLGEAHTKDVQGYDALKGSLAKELRRDITNGVDNAGGFYDWSGLGDAKAAFKAASENLQRFESKRGQSILGKQFGLDVDKTDSEALTRAMLGSESGVNELMKMTQDKGLVSDYLDQYTRSQLQGKSVKQIEDWWSKHSYIEKFNPGLKQEIADYVGKVGILERQAGKFTQAAEGQAKTKLTNQFTSKAASDFVDKLGVLTENGPMQANKVLDAILAKKDAPELMVEVSRLVGQKPGMTENLMNAVAKRLSNTSPFRVMQEFDSIEPALRGFSGVGDAEINQMRQRLQEVVAAAQKNPKVDNTRSFMNALKRSGARTVGRSIFQPMITGRMGSGEEQ